MLFVLFDSFKFLVFKFIAKLFISHVIIFMLRATLQMMIKNKNTISIFCKEFLSSISLSTHSITHLLDQKIPSRVKFCFCSRGRLIFCPFFLN
jgi:hypothetical protein